MPTIYNAANIQAWQSEAQTLRGQRQNQSQLRTEHNQALIPLQSKLQVLQIQISSVQSQITSYAASHGEPKARASSPW